MRPSVQQSISKDKNVMARTRKYYLENNYLTLRSKVKVPRRSLRYAKHSRTSCTHIPNINDLSRKKQSFDLEVKVQRRSLRYATHRLMVMHPHTKYHWPIWKDKNCMARTRKYYLKNNYLTLRLKVKVPQRSLWYATHTWWSCTHIPNIIDLSRKTKMLWPRQENTI